MTKGREKRIKVYIICKIIQFLDLFTLKNNKRFSFNRRKKNLSYRAIKRPGYIKFRFEKPEVMNEVAALEIIRDHSIYYKVR